MYFLQTNNKEKTRLLGLFLSIIMILSSAVTSWAAYDDVSPYPVYRGLINPQENMLKMTVTDAAGSTLPYFALGTGVMSVTNTRFNPFAPMTEMDALAAVVNASGMSEQIEPNPTNWRTGYIDMATQMGIITDVDLAEYSDTPDTPFTKLVTAEKFNKWLSTGLQKETKYKLSPNATVRRIDAAELFHNNQELVAPAKGFTLLKGEIVDQKTITEDGVNKIATSVKQDTGGYITILSNQDIPVVKNGQISLNTTNLSKGEVASFYYKNNQVQFAISEVTTAQTINGTFQSLNGDTLTILDFNNQIRTYKTHPNMVILEVEGELDNQGKSRTIAAKDLIFNQDMQLAVKNGLVHELKTFIPRDSDLDGYIPAESKLIAGVVLDVTANYVTLTDNKQYYINTDTFILRNGELTDYRDIKEGDRVKLFFDDIYTPMVTRAEVEGPQRQVDTIIKGTIDSYALGRGELALKSVTKLNGDRWVAADTSYTKLKLSGDIYDGSKKVTTAKLKDYKGQEIYAVLAKNQNNPTIEKANIRRGSALSFSDEISQVDYPGSYLNIETNLINYTEGTLIVKDGRIVAPGNLQADVGAYVESGTNKNASLIVMNNTQYSSDNKNYPYKIYRGTIEDIFDYSIELGNDKDDRYYYEMRGSVWASFRAGSEGPRISYNDSTTIYDSDYNRGKGKEIPVRDFRDYKYEGSRYDDEDPVYYDRQVYVVTKDDVAISINFLSESGYDEVNTQNVMTGKVKAVDITAKTLTLSEVSKYNSLREIFVPQQTEELIDISKASIISGNKELPKLSAEQLIGKKIRAVYKQNTTRKNNGIVIIVD